MNYNLKDILKNLKIVVVSKQDNIDKKEIDILNLFFKDIIIINSAERALKRFVSLRPDVIICDIELPQMNGIEFCKIIKKINNKIPIIISSKKSKKKYLYEMIRLQIVDFIKKPIKAEEFIFTLNETAKHILNGGNISIKLSNGYIYSYKSKTIKKDDSKEIKLTKNEYRLLELLLGNKEKTLTTEEIFQHLWADEDITCSAFKSLVSRLRNKIGKDSIKNKFGIGYQLD